MNHRGYLGATALARASRAGHVNVLSILLKENYLCNPDIPNDKWQYPLHFAAFKGNLECVELLITSGRSSPVVLDRKGRTPAEDTSYEDIQRRLLEARNEFLR